MLESVNWIQFFLALLIGSIGLVYLRKWFIGPYCKSAAKLNGKTVVVTGCNTGIGKETVLDMSRRGARVVMACRNLNLANRAAEDIKFQHPMANLVIYQLDLADLSSVRKCAKEINDKEKSVDILINNAGIMFCDQMKTKDGFEMQIGTNHFGHFLFTNLLLEKIKRSAPSRIVTVSSTAHLQGHIDLEDINFEKRGYSRFSAYSQSKLANILFTLELSKKLKETGVTCYSVHPGGVMTELGRHLELRMGKFLSAVLYGFVAFFLKTPESGAQTSIFCSVDEALANETGKYYADCHLKTPSKRAQDEEMGQKLWDLSEKYVNLE